MNRFSFSDKLLQQSVAERLANHNTGRMLTPIVVEFDCTTACNLNCAHCINREILGRKFFTEQELLDYADSLHRMGVKAIILMGGGEPLMNPYIDTFIKKLKEHSFQIGMITNGVLLHEHYDALKDIDWVRISMDAATADTFFDQKKRHCFDAVLQNIAGFSQIKTRCSLGYSFLVFKNEHSTNVHELAGAAALAKSLGCDYFEIKLQFEDVGYNHPSVCLEEDEATEIAAQIKRAEALAASGFSVLSNLNIKRMLDPLSYPGQEHMEQCYICHLRTVITPQGLYTCSYHRGHAPMLYGESRGKDFERVWHSDERTRLVEQMDPRNCVNCARGPANMRIAEMLSSPDLFAAVPDSDLFI